MATEIRKTVLWSTSSQGHGGRDGEIKQPTRFNPSKSESKFIHSSCHFPSMFLCYCYCRMTRFTLTLNGTVIASFFVDEREESFSPNPARALRRKTPLLLSHSTSGLIQLNLQSEALCQSALPPPIKGFNY